MIKKIFLILLTLALVLTSLSACEKQQIIKSGESTGVEVNTDEKPSAQITLSYSKNDSLNPFLAETSLNIAIMPLVYDSLFTLDSSYRLNGVIAKGFVGAKGSVNVMLNSEAVFSDGTPVTAQDVITSFEAAKESDTYGERLKNFESVSQSNSSNIIFNLESPDIFAQNCLTFPIVKAATVEDEIPTGSGKYVFEQNGATMNLRVNKKHSGFTPEITCIELTEIKNSQNISTSLEIGNTCFCFDDLSSGIYSRINARHAEVILNNLVYIGLNEYTPCLQNPFVRSAISAAIDRSDIATTAFQSHAKPAQSPFNPSWYAIAGTDGTLTSSALSPEELIEKSGEDISAVTLKILVNADNNFKLEAARIIEKNLQKIGFSTYLLEVEYGYYLEYLRDSQFDIYLGEVRLTDNMDLTELFCGGSCANYMSEDMQAESYPRYLQMLSGECELMDFINVFTNELPFIPVCYRTGLALYTNSLDPGKVICTENDIYGNIAGWTLKKGE